MRYRVHIDFGKHDIAERTAVDDLFQDAHRLVVAHVLIDRDNFAGLRRLVA